MIVSCAILPVCASAVLAVHIVGPGLIRWFVSIAVVMISGTLSFLALESVTKLRESVPPRTRSLGVEVDSR
jgi:hypothetical protein